MNTKITSRDYTVELEAIAETVATVVLVEGTDWTDALHETMDGHQWVIYTAYHYDVLQQSNNDNYAHDEGLLEGHDTVAQTYWALYQDVMDRYGDALSEAQEAYDVADDQAETLCGAVASGLDEDDDLYSEIDPGPGGDWCCAGLDSVFESSSRDQLVEDFAGFLRANVFSFPSILDLDFGQLACDYVLVRGGAGVTFSDRVDYKDKPLVAKWDAIAKSLGGLPPYCCHSVGGAIEVEAI